MERPILARGTLLVVLAIGVAAFGACAQSTVIYPVTTGTHARVDENVLMQKRRIVVWSNHPGVGNSIIGWMQGRGDTVIERAHLEDILNEQKIRLMHTPDDNADILRVSRLIGADSVIFAEVSVKPASQYGGAGSLGNAYHVSVAVRNVAAETGEMLWSGAAHYPWPVTDPEDAVLFLAQGAIMRATCMIEAGYEWRELGPKTKEPGCVKKK